MIKQIVAFTPDGVVVITMAYATSAGTTSIEEAHP